MPLDVNVNVHTIHEQELRDRLDAMSAKIDHVLQQLETLTMATEDMNAAIDAINDATTNIAGDLQRLKDVIKTGMTVAQVKQVQDRLDVIKSRLEVMANDPENPDPQAPPEEPPPA